MQTERTGRYVAVGTRVDDPGVIALLELAARVGLDVRAAALRPPAGPLWQTIPRPTTTTSLLGGLVQQLARRALRGESAELTDALRADDTWLGPLGEQDVLVALDDAAAQALARWKTERQAERVVLTWDQAAERICAEIAEMPAVTSTAVSSTAASSGLTAGRSPGAMHRVVLATAPGAPALDTRELGRRLRARVQTLDPADPAPQDVDVLVLAGLGPAVAQLADLPPTTRVVHLAREEDRSSPWRHLLAAPLTAPARPVVPVPVSESGDLQRLPAHILGEEAAELVRLGRARQDDEALERIRALLPGATDPVLLREMAYLTRATGALTLEQQVLTAQGAAETELTRIEDKLRDTDPTWLPELPATPVEPIPGRVLHLLKTTLPQRQAGYSVRGHHTLRALVEAGVDVVAVALPERADDQPQGEDGVTEEVVDGVRYLLPGPVHGAGTTAYLQAAATRLLDVVADQRPEVLHVHSGHRGYDLGVVGAAIAEASGLPWVYEVRGLFESMWSSDPERAERGETFERRMAREADLVRRADATITLAETMRADLLDRAGTGERIHIVANAVDPEQLRPVDRDPALARQWETDGRFTFGYVSNLDHAREQIEDLIRAAVVMDAAGRHVRVLVVGTGTRAEELAALTRELGAERLVTFTGKVPHDQVASAYALLDVLVVPRGDERAARLVTPLKPFEAMAMGLPVVVSAQPALLEVIGDGERGWSYPAGDAGALAELLGRLADDPEGRAEVAVRGRDWVTRERTWAGNAARCAEIYADVRGRAR